MDKMNELKVTIKVQESTITNFKEELEISKQQHEIGNCNNNNNNNNNKNNNCQHYH